MIQFNAKIIKNVLKRHIKMQLKIQNHMRIFKNEFNRFDYISKWPKNKICKSCRNISNHNWYNC